MTDITVTDIERFVTRITERVEALLVAKYDLRRPTPVPGGGGRFGSIPRPRAPRPTRVDPTSAAIVSYLRTGNVAQQSDERDTAAILEWLNTPNKKTRPGGNQDGSELLERNRT